MLVDDWRKLIALFPNEKVVYEGLDEQGKERISIMFRGDERTKSLKGLVGRIIFTNFRFLFACRDVIIEKKGMFKTERKLGGFGAVQPIIPYEDIDKAGLGIGFKNIFARYKIWEWLPGISIPCDEEHVFCLFLRRKEPYPGVWHLGGLGSCLAFLMETPDFVQFTLKKFNQAYDLYCKEKEAEEIRKRTQVQVVVDFNQLVNMMGQKGLALQVIECPHCGGKVDVPKDGNVIQCKYCGKNIYAIDIFEKFKGILGF